MPPKKTQKKKKGSDAAVGALAGVASLLAATQTAVGKAAAALSRRPAAGKTPAVQKTVPTKHLKASKVAPSTKRGLKGSAAPPPAASLGVVGKDGTERVHGCRAQRASCLLSLSCHGVIHVHAPFLLC